MTNIQAALGLGQLERLEEIILRKREIGEIYNQKLNHLKEFFSMPMKSVSFADNIYWVYGIVLNHKTKFSSSKELALELKLRKIGTRPFFYPLNLQPVIQEKYPWLKKQYFPNAKYLYEKGLYIPSGIALTNKQITYVCENLNDIFTKN
tara:strand:- start:54 stop:500 length:447 start_codon:yes stop_codon:yes gene_type:complete